MYAVYALIDPRDNTVRYIGITEDVYARFQQHINCSGNNFDKNTWLMELREQNIMVVMTTLETTEDRGYAIVREAYWINHYRMLNAPLFNRNMMEVKLKKEVLVRSSKRITRLYASPKPSTSKERSAVSIAQERARIKELAEQGIPRRNICQKMGKGKWFYDTVKQVLDEEGL